MDINNIVNKILESVDIIDLSLEKDFFLLNIHNNMKIKDISKMNIDKSSIFKGKYFIFHNIKKYLIFNCCSFKKKVIDINNINDITFKHIEKDLCNNEKILCEERNEITSKDEKLFFEYGWNEEDIEKYLDKELIKTILESEMINITEERLYTLSEKHNVYTYFDLITFRLNYEKLKRFFITQKIKKVSEQNKIDRQKLNLLYKSKQKN